MELREASENTLDKFLFFSVPQFPHLQNGNNRVSFIGFMVPGCLKQCLANVSSCCCKSHSGYVPRARGLHAVCKLQHLWNLPTRLLWRPTVWCWSQRYCWRITPVQSQACSVITLVQPSEPSQEGTALGTPDLLPHLWPWAPSVLVKSPNKSWHVSSSWPQKNVYLTWESPPDLLPE